MNSSPNPPKAIQRFRIYCILLCVLYFLVTCVGVAALIISPDQFQVDKTIASIFGVLFIFVGLLFFSFAFIGLHMPQRPGAWTFNRFLLFLGISSILLMPFALSLLNAWVKPEVLAWYQID